MAYVENDISFGWNNLWKVELLWEGESFLFGNGWLKFVKDVKDVKMEAGDTLVLYRRPVTGAKTVNAVLMKNEEDVVHESGGIKILITYNYKFRIRNNFSPTAKW